MISPRDLTSSDETKSPEVHVRPDSTHSTNPTRPVGSTEGNRLDDLHPDFIHSPTLPSSGPTTGNESDEIVLHPAYLEPTQFNHQQTQTVCVSNGNRANTQKVELNLDRVNDKRNGRCTTQECVFFVVCYHFL